jgi:hypothetical protein
MEWLRAAFSFVGLVEPRRSGYSIGATTRLTPLLLLEEASCRGVGNDIDEAGLGLIE